MSHKLWKVQVARKKVSPLTQEKTVKKGRDTSTSQKRLTQQRIFYPHFEAHFSIISGNTSKDNFSTTYIS